MKKRLSVALATVVILPLTGYCAEYLAGDEIREKFNDVTFDVHYMPKNKRFQAHTATDGTLHVLRANGNRDRGRTWFVNDNNQRCVTHPKWKNHRKWKTGRCANVLDAGNGEYHQYSENGKQTHVFSNFREGNQL